MKKVLLFLLCIFSIFSLTTFYPHKYLPTSADSGFDSDYGDYDDGGSWGDDSWGDDSWGDDSWGGGSNNDHYGSGGGYSGEPLAPEDIPLFLVLLCTPIVIAITIICCKNANEKRKRYKKQILKTLYYYGLTPGAGHDVEMVQSAYKNYVEIQEAWMNRDLEPVRHLLTDEIYNMYQMQVETLIEDNQINVMSDFEFVCGRVKSKRTKDNIQTIKVILCVNCKDYIEDTTNHKVVNGKRNATITYIYELIFIKDVSEKETTNCPTCGAVVKKKMSSNCPYCNNNLLLSSSNITMSNKKILYQFRR